MLELEIQSSKGEYKPLVPRLGSKAKQIVKTEVDIPHEAHLIKQEHVLKRTKSKSQGKAIT